MPPNASGILSGSVDCARFVSKSTVSAVAHEVGLAGLNGNGSAADMPRLVSAMQAASRSGRSSEKHDKSQHG